MFPIRDHNPSEITPWVTWTLIAVNIAVFLSYWPQLSQDERALSVFFSDWAMIPRLISNGVAWETVLTSMFLHGGWMHLAGNMLFLWIFGDNMEERFGHIGFLAFYILGGIGAALAQIAFSPWSVVPVVGASGAIAAVMGGYLLLYPRARVDVLLILVVIFRIIPVPAWLMLGAWFVIQIFNSAASDADSGGVAYWAHAGGFIVGVVLSIPVWLRLGGPGFWRRTDGHPPHPDATYPLVQSRVPRVPPRR
jgi:membrane associated rhomboid family serine protease